MRPDRFRRWTGWKFPPESSDHRKGVAMYLVVIVVAILSTGAFALFSIISTERHATLIRGDEIQVRAAAESGVEFVRSVCALSDTERTRLGGIDDNPHLFANVEVSSPQGRRQTGSYRFTVLSPKLVDGKFAGMRYGLQNESAKLHLETVLRWETEKPGQGRRALMVLPGMHPGIADSILDWIDPDATPRSSGAELEYYQRIGVPYGPRNAIPVSLEELLLVRDVNRGLLFGSDTTFSFGYTPTSLKPVEQVQSSVSSSIPIPSIPTADPEAEGLGATGIPVPPPEGDFPLTDTVVPLLGSVASSSPSRSERSGSAGSGDRLPWTYYLTTLGAEKEVNPLGIAKYDLNESNLEYLRTQIEQTVDESAADFVIGLRQTTGIPLQTPIDLLAAPPVVLPDSREIVNPFDWSTTAGKERIYKLLDYGTTSGEVVITGRINVNEAPEAVLRAIPELTEDLASRIAARRKSLAESTRRSDLRQPVWLLLEDLVNVEQLQSLWPKITTAGSVYRCQVVGFVDNQGTASRFEVVVDATVQPPRQVFFKDLTMYGRGYPQKILTAQ